MKRMGVVLLLVLLLALLAACGGSGAPAAATPAPATRAPAAQTNEPSTVEPSATEPADAPQALAEDQPTVEAAAPSEEDADASLDLADEETSLKGLKSYKSTWSFEWTGKKDGQDQTVKWLTAESYTADPLATYSKFETSDSLEPSQGGVMEFYQIGSKSYMVSEQDGKPQCTAFSSADSTPTSSMLDRSAFGSISNGKLVGEETVNGIRTKHYQYDEKATGMNLYTKLTGDVWVAVDGGYVVKDVADWEGNLLGLLGGSSTTDVGKGRWTREVTEINQPFEITAPEGCDNPAEALPMMADATEETSFGAMTTYKTASKLADVLKFYQDEMGKAGWKAEGDGMTTGEFATLAFTRDGKKANIVLTRDGDNTAVMITME